MGMNVLAAHYAAFRSPQSASRKDCTMSRIRFGVWAAMALILVPLAGAQSYSVTDLGTLGGGTYSLPAAINDHGAVVGNATLSNGYQHAFVWTSTTGMHDIGTLGGAAARSGARGINDSGEVAGFSYLADGVTYRAFLWTKNAGMQDLGTLGGSYSVANGINDAGEVVGCAYLADGVSLHGFLWTAAAGMQDLGTLGGDTSCAQGINQSGEVAGFSYLADNVTYHAFLWTQSGGMQDLGAFDGANSTAYAVNASGQISGLGYVPPNTQSPLAAVWTPGHGMQSLGTGPGSIGLAINDSGQIVGYFGKSSTVALLWTPTGQAQNLNSLIPPNSGWLLIQAWGINRSGQIVASGTIGTGTHAALLTPTN
jgi:probable HAF family extracellular repeat protein